MRYPENSGGEAVNAAAWIAAFVPAWFKSEGEYAWSKFLGYGNPQASALYGGLDAEAGKAHLDFANYFTRFNVWHEQADGDPDILLRASSALGKFMNAGRVLNVALIQDEMDCDVATADEAVMRQIERICHRIEDVSMPDLNDYWDEFGRQLKLVNDAVSNMSSPEFRMAAASRLMEMQIELFIAFTEASGVIAQPGVSSSEAAQPWAIG